MKIITASKFYYKRGGLESYIFKVSDILKEHGHEIIPYSTNFHKNVPTDYDRYFADYIELNSKSYQNPLKKIEIFQKILYNINAAKNISKLIDYTSPDLVWGFGVHKHLSPSIFIEAKKHSIPTIHRLSDYAIICPNGLLLKNGKTPCSELLCPQKGYSNAIKNNCLNSNNNSIIANFASAAELFLHNKFKLYVDNVDKFIAPSKFLQNTMINSGIPAEKIDHVPIFIDYKKFKPEYDSLGYYIYFGRLTEEKGLINLLKAQKRVNHNKLLIIGDGPLKNKIHKYISTFNLNAILINEMEGEQLHRAVRNARFIILPSQWFDNSPNVILEAYAMGKPVIGSRIGGISEYIEDGLTGFLFDPKNIDEMADKIDYLMRNHILASHMGHYARETATSRYNPETHYQKLSELFNKLNIKNNIGAKI